MKIGIIGCGWLGIKIGEYLNPNNEIYVTTTSKTKVEKLMTKGFAPFVINFLDYEILEDYKSWEKVKELDVIIITIPFSKKSSITILKRRFTNLFYFIDKFEKQIFLMSSIGIYPQIDLEITETTFYKKYLNQSILFVEDFMQEKYPQINILRLGGLMGDDRVFSNYETTAPNQIVNHIHYEDICIIIKKMISLNVIEKTYNVVAPLHPTKKQIINAQLEKIIEEKDEEAYGRKINSTKMQTELNYNFIRANPTEFHNI